MSLEFTGCITHNLRREPGCRTCDDSVTAERVAAGSRPQLHLSHFAVCPQAANWRQSRLKGT